jgi:enoyl-CoA hydratase/carnithine racemase
MSEILVDVRDQMAILTISNERSRNAITYAMTDTLVEKLKWADENSNVRTIIITGAGDVAFSSGHDLNEIGKGSGEWPDPLTTPTNIRKPVIAAINGHCFAAGLYLALSCDLRTASKNATFGSPGAKLGMLPVGGQIQRLPRIFPAVRALEFMMTAEPIDANTAYEMGFLNRLTPVGGALAAAVDIANKIGANSPDTVRAIKEGARIAEFGTTAEFDRFEHRMNDELAKGADAKEGVRAFLEKRKPVFE